MSDFIIPPEKMLSYYGKSFAWAGKILSKQQLQQARIIYAFCRYADDIVDESNHLLAAQQNVAIIQHALQTQQSAHPILRDFLALQQTIQFSLEAAQQLITGMAWDLSLTQINDQAELIQYAYYAAGTVGLLMLPVLQVPSANAVAYAIDLGIAMQLTNIARDVIEDAARGRVYLPRSGLPANFNKDLLLAGDVEQQQHTYQQILAVLQLADRYYASAEQGMFFIPLPARLAILTASRIYRGIGERIRALGSQKYWQQPRVYVNRWRKLGYSLQAIYTLAQQRNPVNLAHNSELHVGIVELVSQTGMLYD